MGLTLVAAHRGLSAEYPENTIAAFRAAAEAGFPAIELDIRRTNDGEVVVLHDAAIDRTTDGNGRIVDMDYDEVLDHDTGAGPIPRLEDTFQALKGWGGLWDIEVKAWRAAEEALHVAHHHRLLDRCQFSSMDPRALETFRDHHPATPRGLITLGPPDLADLDLADEMGCSWIHVDHDFLSDEVHGRLRERGLKVGAWTVNDVDQARHFGGMGVDLLITDTREVLEAIPGTERGF